MQTEAILDTMNSWQLEVTIMRGDTYSWNAGRVWYCRIVGKNAEGDEVSVRREGTEPNEVISEAWEAFQKATARGIKLAMKVIEHQPINDDIPF